MASRPHIQSMSRIDIEERTRIVRIYAGGTLLAETTNALVLKEKGYPPRHYIPAADVRIERMRASDKTSRCPYKGDAEYFHMETEDGVLEDIAWAYPEPLADVAAIRGHVAFYEEKLSVEVG